ncbi:transaldolase family protein [Olsenella sp. YH-ols2217]|uniref:Transaldolase family protein n=1 Tax=Kribbibacterium absianum TaxID=3044210 RepID=A0ABT6ZJA2_9ACTN|nr:MULTISPECIES: transaldolase family protein [unclassified Olsenella]MDJ1122681.1 transaldolase family protein [Olsenella sp. YH-ols2216]MDJ1129119.1 transaldolase family protein [Olsenella sp. YH-ols2217]
MELFLDTSDVDAIAELCELYNVAGVTTNPTIVTKSGKPFDQLMAEIVDVLDPGQKLFAQVVSTDFDGIMEEARRITSLRAENTYVKIPVTRIGMRAIKACKAEGLGVLATAIYAPNQAFMAALNGADYLAPYVNRMCNLGDGIGQVLQLQQMLDVQGVDSKVIAASFKNVQQVNELIAGGIEAVTIPVDVAYNMIDNPSTPIAVDEFTANWEKAYGTTAL